MPTSAATASAMNNPVLFMPAVSTFARVAQGRTASPSSSPASLLSIARSPLPRARPPSGDQPIDQSASNSSRCLHLALMRPHLRQIALQGLPRGAPEYIVEIEREISTPREHQR